MRLYKRKRGAPKFLPEEVNAIQYTPDTIGQVFREVKKLNPDFEIHLHPFKNYANTIREGDFVLVMKDDIAGYSKEDFMDWFEEVG